MGSLGGRDGPIKGAAMKRVFITRSSDGLGLMAAKLLIEQGHEVVIHARNDATSPSAIGRASLAIQK
jgi:NAD(P)-dependent dehydrogenase (short-subunit alcohol dehydrogenase family)